MARRPRTLAQAVSNWIRAEYMFRHGPWAYERPWDARLVRAEEQLRQALTGASSLGRAAALLGVDRRGLEAHWQADRARRAAGSKRATGLVKAPRRR